MNFISSVSAELSVATSNVFLGDAFDLSARLPDESIDLIVTSPPYNIGKSYERGLFENFEQYKASFEFLAQILEKKLRQNGSICWQVGNFVERGTITPLDFVFFEIFRSVGFVLRNRIIWKFNFGLNARNRLSGRYETVLWFTRDGDYKFNLDPIRVRQLYPGKTKLVDGKHLPSGNPKGKNPSDFWIFEPEEAFLADPVWDIPNVKAGHPEKSPHPCQFPNEVAERCILAFSDEADTVLDPFAGVGTVTSCAAARGRIGIGFELDELFQLEANNRLKLAEAGLLPVRPSGVPPRQPKAGEKVARLPAEWED